MITPTNPEHERAELQARLSKIEVNLWHPEGKGQKVTLGSLVGPDQIDDLATYIAKELSQTEKAYGGCHNCYGKGYATANTYASAKGKQWRTSGPMQYCICERGKQLKTLVAKEVAAAREGYVKKESAEWHRQEMIKCKASMANMSDIERMANDRPGSITRMYRYHKSMYDQLTLQDGEEGGSTS